MIKLKKSPAVSTPGRIEQLRFLLRSGQGARSLPLARRG
jgi:hypothetical protein